MCSFRQVFHVLALGAFVAAAASATTIFPVDAAQAVDEAELIFTGRVVEVEVATSRDGQFPFTFVTFAVEATFKGASAEDELTLRFQGGDLAESGETVEVIGMPRFERGDEVVLFVQGNGDAACPLIGWWQGKLNFVNHPSTGERLLIDHRGSVIEGVSADGWSYSDVRYDSEAQRFVAPSQGAELLWQDGVVIEAEPTSKSRAAGYAGVAATTVLDGLRQLVGERQTRKGFTRATTVRSASPVDVPDSVTFTAVAPAQEGPVK